MKHLLCAAVLLLVLSSSPSTMPAMPASHNLQTRPITVKVQLALHDPIAGQVDMEIRRNIRRLGDVQVQDQDADYELIVTLLTIETGSRRTGYAMSTVIAAPYNGKRLRGLLTGPVDAETMAQIDSRMRGTAFYLSSMVDTAPLSQVEDLCASAVAFLDRVAIEPARQTRQR
jgi:hypothetical protein